MNIFTNFIYLLFLVPSVFLSYFNGIRKYVLALFGMLFYLYFAREYFFLLLFASVIVYWMARKRAFIIPGIVMVVGLLCYFKYFNFFIRMVDLLTGATFLAKYIAVPLAISFFTFEFVHYLVDTYKGKIDKHSFMDYLVFIFFFPTMVAGPIKRFQHFVVQIGNKPDASGIQAGITRILIGIAKKVVIADTMNIWALELTNQSTSVDLWIGVIAYTIKIYADFSAYSDIAIGSARCFGIVVPENFNYPYLARNISEFWKRWHISLSRWITDYIFIPLGGSRVALSLILINILIAMGVSGLWHGAATHFVVWGLYHGALLCIMRLYSVYIADKFQVLKSRYVGVFSWMITMAAVMFGWMLFVMPLSSIIPALKIMLGVS